MRLEGIKEYLEPMIDMGNDVVTKFTKILMKYDPQEVFVLDQLRHSCEAARYMIGCMSVRDYEDNAALDKDITWAKNSWVIDPEYMIKRFIADAGDTDRYREVIDAAYEIVRWGEWLVILLEKKFRPTSADRLINLSTVAKLEASLGSYREFFINNTFKPGTTVYGVESQIYIYLGYLLSEYDYAITKLKGRGYISMENLVDTIKTYRRAFVTTPLYYTIKLAAGLMENGVNKVDDINSLRDAIKAIDEHLSLIEEVFINQSAK